MINVGQTRSHTWIRCFSEGNAVERRKPLCSARWLGGSGFAAREACGSGFHRAWVEPEAAIAGSKAASRCRHRRACGPKYGTDGGGPVRRRSWRGRRRSSPQIEQCTDDHQCQWWDDGLQPHVVGSIQAQQCVHQSQLPFTACPSLSFFSDRRQTRPEEAGGEHGDNAQRESAETKCFQSDPSSASQSVAWPNINVVPVAGQWHHTKLLPKSNQEVQTSSQHHYAMACVNAAEEERRGGVWRTPKEAFCCWGNRSRPPQQLHSQCPPVSSRLSSCRRDQSSVQPFVSLSSPLYHPLHLPSAPRTLNPILHAASSTSVDASRPPATLPLQKPRRSIGPYCTLFLSQSASITVSPASSCGCVRLTEEPQASSVCLVSCSVSGSVSTHQLFLLVGYLNPVSLILFDSLLNAFHSVPVVHVGLMLVHVSRQEGVPFRGLSLTDPPHHITQSVSASSVSFWHHKTFWSNL